MIIMDYCKPLSWVEIMGSMLGILMVIVVAHCGIPCEPARIIGPNVDRTKPRLVKRVFELPMILFSWLDLDARYIIQW